MAEVDDSVFEQVSNRVDNVSTVAQAGSALEHQMSEKPRVVQTAEHLDVEKLFLYDGRTCLESRRTSDDLTGDGEEIKRRIHALAHSATISACSSMSTRGPPERRDRLKSSSTMSGGANSTSNRSPYTAHLTISSPVRETRVNSTRP